MHAAHAPPIGPQVESDKATQELLLQHPVVHELLSQVHAPSRQRCPVAQAAPAPHRHAPMDEQLSAVPPAQVTQVIPPAPQLDVSVGTLHEVPLQHPEGQEVPSQIQNPPEQR
jgi:hypothetical protein